MVVKVTVTPGTTPVPVPDSVIAWLTGRPGAAANGVDVSAGTTSTVDGAAGGAAGAKINKAATAAPIMRHPNRPARRSSRTT